MSYHFDGHANLRKRLREMTSKQKTETAPPRPQAPVPDPITFAGPGVHRASDGNDYTITYQPEEAWEPEGQ